MRRSKDKKKSKAKAIKYFNEWIRFRDKGKNCCTCNKPIIDGDAGHFISCSQENTRFDERNVHLQCTQCNRFKYGKQYEYSLFIDNTYGKGMAEELLIKSKQFSSNRTQYDYEIIAEKYFNKLR